MRPRRLIAPVLLGLALTLITGCTESTSPAARAWERSSAMTRRPPTDPQGALVARDGLGGVIFTPETASDTPTGRSTFAHVPGE